MLDFFCGFAVKENQDKLMLLFPCPLGIAHKTLPFRSPEILFVGTEAIGQNFLG